MRFRARRSHTTEGIPKLPLVAFIDVVLFILLYFLMAGNLAPPERELESALGVSKGADERSSFAPQIVNVGVEAGAPVYRIGARAVRDRDALTNVMRALVTDQGVFIRVDGDAPVGAAAAAVQAAHDAGFEKISYVPAR